MTADRQLYQGASDSLKVVSLPGRYVSAVISCNWCSESKVVPNKFTLLSTNGQNEIIGKNYIGVCLRGEQLNEGTRKIGMKICTESICSKCSLFKVKDLYLYLYV